MESWFATPPTALPSQATVLGPVDRTSFFDAQRRHQRATWRLAVVCGLALVCLSLPVSLVLSPLVYLLAIVVINLLHFCLPVPGGLAMLQHAGNLAFDVFASLGGEALPPAAAAWLPLGVVLWFVPGLVLVTLLWFGIYTLFRHAGVGGIALTLGARPLRAEDLEERQLGHLAEEMALAAGLPAPRLLLLDTPVLNAAVVGTTPADATLLVSRPLLDTLDRAQTQGVIGHLIGSLGNGDLRIAFLMTSVLLTCGALVTCLNAARGPHGRTALGQVLRLCRSGWRHTLGGREETVLLKTLLTEDFEIGEEWLDEKLDTRLQKVVFMLWSPFMMTSIAVSWTLYILIPGVLKPCLALLWRRRRLLADATAVQLTRNPDGLARALTSLSAREMTLPQSQGLEHLFLRGPVGASSLGEVFFKWQGPDMHPPLQRRLQRLQSLGASVALQCVAPPLSQEQPVWGGRRLLLVVRVVLGLLLPIAAATCLAAMLLFMLISLFFMGLLIMVVQGVFVGLHTLLG